MKTTVIGNTGFIGSHLIKALLKNNIPAAGFNSKKPIFSGDRTLVKEIIDSDYIFWAAGNLNPISAKHEPFLVEQELEIWREFIAALENSMFSISGKKLIFLSSGGCVYDYSRTSSNEDSPASGSNDYGRAKVEMEKVLLNSSIASSVLRLSNVYGIGQKTGRGQGVIAEWINAVQHNLPLRVFGDTSSSRDYLHISDLISALLLCRSGLYSGILNLGSGKATTLQEVLESFTIACGRELNIQYEPGRESDKSSYHLDISRAERILGWKPILGIQQGIHKIIAETQNAE